MKPWITQGIATIIDYATYFVPLTTCHVEPKPYESIMKTKVLQAYVVKP
jgi:hypothetical protein